MSHPKNRPKLMPLILNHSVTQSRLITFHPARFKCPAGPGPGPPPGSQYYVQILQNPSIQTTSILRSEAGAAWACASSVASPCLSSQFRSRARVDNRAKIWTNQLATKSHTHISSSPITYGWTDGSGPKRFAFRYASFKLW